MRKSIKSVCAFAVVTAALTAGQAMSDTTINNDGIISRQSPSFRSQTTQPYNEIRSELSYARQRADGRLGTSSASTLSSASKEMDRAIAYRDKGDMKNACRWATKARTTLERANYDRNSPMVQDYAAIQAEFCAATDAA